MNGMSKLGPWKLYWIETPDGDENWFVIAKNSRSAAAYEDTSTGFNPGDCKAVFVKEVPEQFLRQAELREQEENWRADGKPLASSDPRWPGYPSDWLLETLGVDFISLEGRKTATVDGKRYAITSLEELYLNRSPDLIRSTVDLIHQVTDLPARSMALSWSAERNLDIAM